MERKLNRLVNGMLTKNTLTENYMPTHTTSSSHCLDWFGCVGSVRAWSNVAITSLFTKALEEDPLVAMRILFWARDIRGGSGERRVFRICIDFLNRSPVYRSFLDKNIHLIPEYGRWDDLFEVENHLVLPLIAEGLASKDGLLAKWLPRKGVFANKVRNFLRLSPKDYRQKIVGLSKTVEQLMCSKQWGTIKYEQVPSIAMNKYRKAFFRNDDVRFKSYIESVVKGETTIKAGVLYPYDLYIAWKRGEDRNAVEAQWKNLPNFMQDCKYRLLPMCDVSGSMNSLISTKNKTLTAMAVSVSLGIYISERNEGPFKDCFLTFSSKPTLQQLKGSFSDRCGQLLKAHWEMNTNLEATFSYLLRTAIANKITEDEMPNAILILSDMQFDSCVCRFDLSALEMIKQQYAEAGYNVPKVVFWNINARVDQMPVKHNDVGVAIVSGCSPSILKSLLSGDIPDPVSIMLDTVMSERYEKITI